jgi:hypothetical protein
MKLSRPGKLIVLVACIALVLTYLVLPTAWRRFCGNYRIEVYGRIVDELGVGISGAKVETSLTYQSSPTLMPFTGSDASEIVTTTTDSSGNFRVGPVYGTSLNMNRVFCDDMELVPAMQLPELVPSMRDLSMRLLIPDTPAKRVTFTFRRE